MKLAMYGEGIHVMFPVDEIVYGCRVDTILVTFVCVYVLIE